MRPVFSLGFRPTDPPYPPESQSAVAAVAIAEFVTVNDKKIL